MQCNTIIIPYRHNSASRLQATFCSKILKVIYILLGKTHHLIFNKLCHYQYHHQVDTKCIKVWQNQIVKTINIFYPHALKQLDIKKYSCCEEYLTTHQYGGYVKWVSFEFSCLHNSGDVSETNKHIVGY